MAKTKSAKKARRVASRRRVFNLRRKSTMKSSVKSMEKLVLAKKAADAAKSLPELQQAIDKAAKNGTIKKNTAARMKSRIAKRLAALAK